ncbi:MAG: hypothetical protein H7Z76_09445, partial [Methylotenera sp.]|nr:hypothetical protein [Flavobacterium sp.]
MNKILGILFLLFSNHILAADYQDTCISTNCDVYREEKAKFLALLKEIKCTSQTDTSKDCDQIALSKLSADFSKRMAVLFNSPNVGAAIKNDIQFNSLTNTFAEKKQNAPGYYELVPVLANPNIGVHWGGVQNNQAIVDRIVDIDPASPSVQNSNWYLTQWKKDTPLMLSSTRSDPISSNGPSSDSYLGKSKFEINAPVGKFGVETSLLIFKNPADNSNVFEIVGRNGWLDEAGGSNVFLSSDLMDNDHSHFDFDINLTFNGKISKMKSKYNDNSSETKGEVVVGQAFAAFTALYTPPNGGDSTSVFIQLLFGDTRGENFLYTGCYMLGSGSQIVYTHNLDNDFAASADSASAPLKPKKYNLNKYLCNALSQKFSCPSTIKKPDFSTMSKNLKNWKMTGFYTGVETQVAKASSADKSIPGPTKGQMEMGLQYSNMRVNANSNLQALDCATVLNRPEVSDPVVVPAPVVVTAPVEAGSCSKGSFKDGAGKTIDFYCGCGVVA